jgi:hypothetical protein
VGRRLKLLAAASAPLLVASIAQLGSSAAAPGSSFVVTPGAAAPGNRLGGVAALASNDVWAVGTFQPTGPGYDDAGLEPFAEHFDGAAWTQTPVAGTRFNDDDLVATAAVSHSDAWAVGFRKRTGFKSPVTTLTYHWNGAAWTEVATPVINGSRYSFAAVSATATNDVWAVGSAATAPSTAQNALAEHWNGTAWTRVPVPLPAGTTTSALLGVSARAANNAWAVGTANGHTFTAHWNGATWAVVASADTPPQRSGATVSDSLTAVTAVSPTNVWAIGYATDTVNGSFLPYRTVVEHWDGVRWSLVTAPSPFNHPQLTGVSAVSATDVWAMGSGWNDVATGVPVATPIFLHFDGTRWSSVAPPANVGGGDNLLKGVSAVAATGDVWAVGSSPSGALIERRA